MAQGSAAVGLGLVESGKMPKPLTKLLNVSRKYSVWVYQWGLACCAIEMAAALAAPRYDVMRLGVIPLPASPRQADLMIVSGTVTDKMAPSIRRLWEQMPDPKYVIAMGACTVGGGPYFKYGYHVVKGVDLVVPVDVYVPGCPPRPEALLEGLMRIQDKIRGQKIAKQRGSSGFGQVGTLMEDDLPLPHHSGYVAVEEKQPLFDHQKITG